MLRTLDARGVTDLDALLPAPDEETMPLDAVRDILAEYTEIPPEVAQSIKLPQWRKDLTLPTIERLSQLSLEYGLIEEEPNLDELIAD